MPEIRAYTAEANDVDRDARTVVATINTDALDRYKTVVDPAGAKLDNYRKNPVVLFNHGDLATPIGKNLWIKSSRKKLIAKTRFLPAGMDETADKVFELYAQGFLNGWSVSFDPIDAGPPTPEEVKARPALAECRCVYRAWDLLEYSAVTIPANPEATRQARAAGLALPTWADEPAEPPTLPPLRGRTVAQVKAAIARQIAELAGDPRKIARDVIDLARGQV